MTKPLWVAVIAICLGSAPGLAAEKKKKPEKKKVETGASCKAPAIGPCAACNITCRPGEIATCGSGQVFNDVCHIQPSCRCTR